MYFAFMRSFLLIVILISGQIQFEKQSFVGRRLPTWKYKLYNLLSLLPIIEDFVVNDYKYSRSHLIRVAVRKSEQNSDNKNYQIPHY